MDLFLAITLQEDPLYLPVELSGRLKSTLPDVTFFQVDTHASPELMQTAIKAMDSAESAVFFIDGVQSNLSSKPLFPLFKQITRVSYPALWVQRGDVSLGVFKNLITLPRLQVTEVNQLVTYAKEFFESQNK